ncbi:MAG: hypothetical protein H7067_10455 [Burkholderiales bacterium]|nr:hypothetical protein [Opitutaceae bacterium]
MFPNILGLLCAALALVGFTLAHRRAQNWPRAQIWRWLAVGTLASLPALYNASHYLHVIPEAAWFYEVRSWRGTELLVISVGPTAGLLAALLPRRLLLIPLLACVGVTWGPFLKPVLGPIKHAALRDVWIKDVCIQSTFSTCGPASTATILRTYGQRHTEEEIARVSHSYIGGTEAWYLARYIRAQGLRARFSLREEGFPTEVHAPAILGVTLEGRGHFIPLLARDGDAYLIGDPMNGPERLTRAQLDTRYGFTGFALEILPE